MPARTRREPFNPTPLYSILPLTAVKRGILTQMARIDISIPPPIAPNPVSSGSPHVRPMGVHRTCGEPDEIKKDTHPECIAALAREQDHNPGEVGYYYSLGKLAQASPNLATLMQYGSSARLGEAGAGKGPGVNIHRTGGLVFFAGRFEWLRFASPMRTNTRPVWAACGVLSGEPVRLCPLPLYYPR